MLPQYHIGQDLRRPRANMANIEPREQPPQGARARRLDSLQQVIDRFFSHPLEADKLVAAVFESINVGEALHQTQIGQLFDQFDSQSFDIHRRPRREKSQALAELCRTVGVRAADVDASFVLDDRRLAFGTDLRKVKFALAPFAAVFFDADDVRDDLPRLFDDDPVADFHT